MSRKVYPRCSAATPDGSQCGRRDKSGSIPPLCHAHRLQAQGQSPMFQPVVRPPEEILQKLMNSGDESIRLNATKFWLDLQAKKQNKCEQCEARREWEQHDNAWRDAMTEEEFQEAMALLQRYEAIKQAVYKRVPAVRPDDYVEVLQVQPPPAVAPTVPVARLVKPKPQPETLVEVTAEPDAPREPVRRELTPDRYHLVGITKMRVAGQTVLVHALGDEHRDKILSGEIPYDEAVKQHQHATQQFRRRS